MDDEHRIWDAVATSRQVRTQWGACALAMGGESDNRIAHECRRVWLENDRLLVDIEGFHWDPSVTVGALFGEIHSDCAYLTVENHCDVSVVCGQEPLAAWPIETTLGRQLGDGIE